MSADLINLRTVRKNKLRIEGEKRASDNRIMFGRTKTERKITKIEIERATKTLEDHKRET